MVNSKGNNMSTSKFGIVPKDIEGVLMCMDQMYEKLQELEKNHAEVKTVVSKIESKLLYLITGVIVAVGAKYGMDFSGIAH